MLPHIAVSGVRKSWETDASKALRNCSVSPCRRAASRSSAKRARANAWARGWLSAVSRRRRWAVSDWPSRGRTPNNAKGPSSTDKGHHHQRLIGNVSVPWPAA
ncbi:hypothetical protein D3C76_438420 [compost metagenome]